MTALLLSGVVGVAGLVIVAAVLLAAWKPEDDWLVSDEDLELNRQRKAAENARREADRVALKR